MPFINGYELPGSHARFRFTAQTRDQNAIMGDEIISGGGVTLGLPAGKNGMPVDKRWSNDQNLETKANFLYLTNQPGFTGWNAIFTTWENCGGGFTVINLRPGTMITNNVTRLLDSRHPIYSV